MDKNTFQLIIHAGSVIPVTGILFYWFLKKVNVTANLISRAAALSAASYVIGWLCSYFLLKVGLNTNFSIILNIIIVGLILSYILALPKIKIWLASFGIVLGGQFLAGTIVLTILNNFNNGT